MMKEKNSKKKKKSHKSPRNVFGNLKIRIRWPVGKMCKDKKLHISFIQIKGKNKEELGSDRKERIEPLFSSFEIVI